MRHDRAQLHARGAVSQDAQGQAEAHARLAHPAHRLVARALGTPIAERTKMMQALDLTPLRVPLHALQLLEADVSARLLERQAQVRAMIVAILSQQHLALIGPPGTAKSLITELVAERMTPTAGGSPPFVWLLTRFTTPDELFGPISVQGLKQDVYRRITTGKLPEATFAFLDEMFTANSAILNALLSLLNERVFDNGLLRMRVPLMTCVGASNALPHGEDLHALWDRFALRQMTSYVSDSAFGQLLRLAALATPPQRIDPADLVILQQAGQTLPIPDGVLDAIAHLRNDLGGQGIIASDRRWRQSLTLIRAHALIEERGLVEEDDLSILADALWNTPDQRGAIARIVARLANPLVGKAVELGDQAAHVYDMACKAQQSASDDQQKMQLAVEAATKLKSCATQVKRLHEQAQAQGRNTARFEKVASQIRDMQTQIAALVL
jgi:MoxR-like ATPase